MRLVLAMVLAALAALPLSASAQAGEEGTAAEPKAVEPAQSTEPTRSRLERWHPEAFEDPKKPASEPAMKLELDSTALEVTPTAPPTLEELERQEKKRRRRAIGIGVGVSVAVVVIVLVAGSVAVNKSISRGFE